MRIAKTGDIYSIWSEELNKWTLIQVIQEKDDNQIGILDLDAFFDKLPSKKDLANLKPLIINHHNWSDVLNCRYISTNIVPERIKYVANIEPIIETEINTYSFGWPKDSLQNILQYKWNQIDKERTSNYKKAKNSDSKIKIGRREIKLNSYSIFIEKEDDIDVFELSKLPALTEIHFTGENKELVDFIASNPLISTLELKKHNQKTLDFSKTNIDKLMLDISDLECLKLNTEIRFLSIFGDFNNIDKLKIEHPLDGKFLEINHYSKPDIEIPNFNLINLSKLSLLANHVNFNLISDKYPNLESVKIWGKPGYISEFKHLSKLKKIKTIQLQDLFGFSVNDIPKQEELPQLEFLWLTSVPKEVGQFVKKEFKHIPNLSVTKLRDEKWLVENLNNPFRSWDGRDGILKVNAKKAFNAFKKLNGEIEKLTQSNEIKNAFLEFIEVFNIMDKKSKCIETIEREDIYEVYMTLAEKSSINKDILFDLFEKNRGF